MSALDVVLPLLTPLRRWRAHAKLRETVPISGSSRQLRSPGRRYSHSALRLTGMVLNDIGVILPDIIIGFVLPPGRAPGLEPDGAATKSGCHSVVRGETATKGEE